jgi:hypothetical protein
LLAALAALGFVIQILPGLDQVNGELIAMLLPADVAFAFGLTRRGFEPLRERLRVSPFAR